MEHALIANNHLIAELSSSIRINTDNKQLFKTKLVRKAYFRYFRKNCISIGNFAKCYESKTNLIQLKNVMGGHFWTNFQNVLEISVSYWLMFAMLHFDLLRTPS